MDESKSPVVPKLNINPKFELKFDPIKAQNFEESRKRRIESRGGESTMTVQTIQIEKINEPTFREQKEEDSEQEFMIPESKREKS